VTTIAAEAAAQTSAAQTSAAQASAAQTYAAQTYAAQASVAGPLHMDFLGQPLAMPRTWRMFITCQCKPAAIFSLVQPVYMPCTLCQVIIVVVRVSSY
jgi:hypothetical protein